MNRICVPGKWYLKAACVLITAGVALYIDAADWPQWRGPHRDGKSSETGLLKEWPKEGPKLLWQVKDLGDGYSTPSVAGERLYLLGNNGVEEEHVQARAVKDGSVIWTAKLGAAGNPNQQPNFPGGRSTPTVTREAIYALSSDGDLAALDFDGKIQWQKSLRRDFGGKPGTWAYSESPLIDGDALICSPGGAEATMVALHKKTGEVIWKSAIPSAGDAAYASPIIVNAGGVKQYVQLLQKGLVGVDAKTGQLLWIWDKPVSRYGANIPSPIADGPVIYAGSAGTGGGAIKLVERDGKLVPEQLYFESKLPTAIGGVLHLGDFLYGTANSMLCVDFMSGKVKWEDRGIGPASLCYADGRIYAHGENGAVALIDASPDGYHEQGRFTPRDAPVHVSPMQKAWPYPVISGGRLYVRDLNSLWCYDVKPKQ